MIYVIFLVLTSCVSVPYSGVYNQDDLQNPGCYKEYGGMHGYCDQR